MELPANPSTEEVLRIGREAMADARCLIESVGTEGEADASLKAYLLRVVRCLESLFDPAPADDGETRILAYALSSFLPILDLDWLPTGAESLPKLTKKDRVIVGALQRERAIQAAKKPSARPSSRWNPLIDVISESFEMFVIFGYHEGFSQFSELLDAIEVQIASTSRALPN
jgi:hypothetical protein